MTQAPSIDGSLREWAGTLTKVGGRPVSMGALRTDSLLYVALSIRGRALVRSVIKRGLIVWVDPAGKQQHTYGIRYPMGLRAQRAKTVPDAPSTTPGGSSGLGRRVSSELAVLRNDTLRRRRPAANFSSGLRVGAVFNAGSMLYEVAIPTGGSAPDSATEGRWHGLRATLEGPVGIGLVTPETDESITGSSRGIPSVTGRGRRGRVPRGRRRGRRPSPRPRPADPTLHLWTRLVPRGGP